MTDTDRSGDPGPATDEDGPILATYDWSSTAPSTGVVETVATAGDREPTALEPLYASVDPDALDALVRSNGTRPTDGDVTVTFAFAGHEVTVSANGAVVVRPLEPRSEPE